MIVLDQRRDMTHGNARNIDHPMLPKHIRIRNVNDDNKTDVSDSVPFAKNDDKVDNSTKDTNPLKSDPLHKFSLYKYVTTTLSAPCTNSAVFCH